MTYNPAILEIELLSYWHAGSGFGRGADADALVLKDPDSLPYLPGRTVKGLLREAMQCCEDSGAVPPGTTAGLFGAPAKEGHYTGSVPGKLTFGNARMKEAERAWLSSPEGAKVRDALFDTVSSTSIDSTTGTAESQTLRTIELCVPLTLEAEIGNIPGDDAFTCLARAASLLRALGSHRTRGLGRCSCTLRKGSERDGK